MGVDDLFALKLIASPPPSTQIHSIQSVQSVGIDDLFALKFTVFQSPSTQIQSIQSMGVHDLFALVTTPHHLPKLFITHIYVRNMKQVISNQ